MKFAKIFALSLSLVSPFVLARVQCNATIEVNGFSSADTRPISTEAQLDINSPVEFYAQNDLIVIMELLEENTEEAIILATIFAKNENGDLEKVSEPSINLAYGQEATYESNFANGKIIFITSKIKRTTKEPINPNEIIYLCHFFIDQI